MQSCGTEGWNDNYAASDWIFNRKEKVIYKTMTDLAISVTFQTPQHIPETQHCVQVRSMQKKVNLIFMYLPHTWLSNSRNLATLRK